MTFKFAFRIHRYLGNGVSRTFKADDGEEYEVTLGIDRTCKRTVEITWKDSKSKIVKFTLYSRDTRDTMIKDFEGVKEDRRIVKFHLTFPSSWATAVVEVLTSRTEFLLQVDSNPPVSESPKQNFDQFFSVVTITRLEQLGASMKKLLQTGEFSDITLSDGTRELRAHKMILSLHSPVFAKMFQNPMKERQENRVLVQDVPMDIMKTLLLFMYSGTVTIDNREIALQLYFASDKYDVRSLRYICTEVLLKSMDVTNVIETLVLADLYGDEILKQAALDFITKQYSKLKVMNIWKKFVEQYQTLSFETLRYVVDKKL